MPAGRRELVLDPDEFYILASAEAVVRRRYSRRRRWSPTIRRWASCVRITRAFLILGSAWPKRAAPAASIVLEVRSHDVPFLLDHGQRVATLEYEAMERAARTGSMGRGASTRTIRARGLKLSKHFVVAPSTLRVMSTPRATGHCAGPTPRLLTGRPCVLGQPLRGVRLLPVRTYTTLNRRVGVEPTGREGMNRRRRSMDDTHVHTHVREAPLQARPCRRSVSTWSALTPGTRYDRFRSASLRRLSEHTTAELCFEPGAITYGYFEDGPCSRRRRTARCSTSKDRPSLRKDAEAAFSVETCPGVADRIGTEVDEPYRPCRP